MVFCEQGGRKFLPSYHFGLDQCIVLFEVHVELFVGEAALHDCAYFVHERHPLALLHGLQFAARLHIRVVPVGLARRQFDCFPVLVGGVFDLTKHEVRLALVVVHRRLIGATQSVGE